MRTDQTVPQETFTNLLVGDRVFGYELPNEVLQGYFSWGYLAITQGIFETSVLSAAHTLRVDWYREDESRPPTCVHAEFEVYHFGKPSEMAQLTKVLSIKPANQRLSPGPTWWKEKTNSHKLFWYIVTSNCTYKHVQNKCHNKIKVKHSF